jgi:N12 class adenine-specific DNA methylase
MVETTTATRGIGEIGRARASVAAIETLADIRRRARTVATDAERATLSGWSGWGPLTKLFTADETWVPMAERVRAVLPEPDVNMGMRGTYMAFYTPREIAAGIWEMLRLFGYDGGPVAELGCGGGVFFATAPEGTPLVGVERDPTAAGICKLMNPHVKVINESLEKTHLPSKFSAVVGNVPFGDVHVHDLQAPRAVTGSLHNYFIWRAVQALAPGGYAVLVTSRYTMDSWQFDARSEISESADFVGALRLPNGALGGGTDTLADIVILRRKGGTDLPTYGQAWQDTQATPWDPSTSVNGWWLAEPHTVLGEMGQGTTGQYGLNLVVKPREGRGSNLVQQMLSVTRHMVNDAKQRNLTWTPPARPEAFDARDAGVIDDNGWHEGSMRLDDRGGVLVVKDGKAQPLPGPKPELLRLIRMRDLAVELTAAEADYQRPDSTIEPIRADLAAEYEAYVKRHGPLNRYKQRSCGVDAVTGEPQWKRIYPTWQGFRHDPDSFLVLALEVFEEPDDGDVDEQDAAAYARPAPILTSRQNRPPRRPRRTDNPEQALAWSLDRCAGQVHLGFIAELLGRPLPDGPAGARAAAQAEVAGLLGDKVYRDPETLRWLTAEEYLSGDVRGKHAVAERAASADSDFARNVTALAAVLPQWQEPGDITAQLGTPWIGAKDLQTFVSEVIGYSATIRRANGQWEVDTSGIQRSSVAGSAVWGTEDVDAFTLLQLALNGKTPTVYRTVCTAGGDEKRVKDQDRSLLATNKQEEMKARFEEWVWEDPQRTDRLVHHYNTTYNNLRARQYDGSHITVDGMADWFHPYPHQREFVARALATPAALCGHPVGAGKTAAMAMTAVKLKQAGLIRKPMLVVPNHLIEQVAREIMQLFPAARVLVGSAKTIAAKRLAFTARCATQDWDLVLVTHSAFNAMDVDPDTQAAYYDQLEEEMRNGVVEGAPGRELKGRMVKALAKALDKMRARIQDLREKAHGRDKGVRFEQLGVDYLLVDEFHYYKNLAMPCNTEGFSVQPSQRATDLDMKIQYLRARNSDGPHVALFSGTPISNTMLELYVCLHYTMRPYLKEIGLGSADAWAAAYVKFVTSVEVTVDGGDFQMRTRPALFVNAPELRVLLSQSADIRTADQLGLKRPASELHIVTVEPTDTQAWYSTELVERAEDVRSRIVNPDVDNMLKICTDGRRMATDPYLVGLADNGEYKLNVVADRITAMWQEHPGKLQAAFLDLGTPKQRKEHDGPAWTDYQSYGRLRRMLTDRGMDVTRIRFIHDAKSDAEKARLFRDCRTGKVDVIVGSTDKLGVGTNIQNLIVAMHHVDAPFRPADVEQRDGRGLRPGNTNKLVHVLRYVTKRTFDAYMWQMLTRKLTFIGQMLSGNLDRTVEDVTGDDVLSFAAIKAAATDQPLLQEKATVEAQVKKLKLSQQGHRRTVLRMAATAPAMRGDARNRAADAKAWAAIAAHAADLDPGDEDVITQILEEMPQFAYYRPPLQFGQLTVSWRRWSTGGDRPDAQPLLTVDGGDGYVTEKAYKFWKAGKLAATLRGILDRAAGEAKHHLREQQRLLAEADKCDTVAAQPFEQGEQLTEALARLARIERDLHDAASTSNGPVEADGDIVLEAEPMSADEVARVQALAGSVLGGLFEHAADELDDEPDDEQDPAEQIGDRLATLLGF